MYTLAELTDVTDPAWPSVSQLIAESSGLSVYAFLWSQEAQDDLVGTNRKPAPTRELLTMHGEFTREPLHISH